MRNVPARQAGNYPKDAYVGPYWFVRDDADEVILIAHRCSLPEAEEYGEFLTCPHGHYDVWERWRVKCPIARIAGIVRESEYEEWPRGRVVYNAKNQRFIVYADAQILNRPDLLTIIHERFGLPAEGTEAKRDGHYVSTRRLGG